MCRVFVMRKCIYLKNLSGVYIIFNSVNNKVYVGQTECFYRRCSQYIYDFETRAIGHLNDYLYRAIKKVGIDNFDFIPVEFIEDKSKLIERERFWIEQFRSTERNFGYNLRIDDERSGLITNPETSRKMSENLKRQWASGVRDSHSDKLKKSWKENPHRRETQSKLFTRYKTKYEYKVLLPEGVRIMNYADLVEMGLHSVISNFHRKKSNDVVHKGIRIIRAPLGEME